MAGQDVFLRAGCLYHQPVSVSQTPGESSPLRQVDKHYPLHALVQA